MKKYDLVLTIMGLAVLTVTVATLFLFGSPFDNRLKAFDQQKFQTIQQYKGYIENYYGIQRRLPVSIAEAQSALSSQPPEIDSSIEYQITGDAQYQLCATFNYDDPNTAYLGASDPYSGTIKATYKKGYDCLIYQIPEYIKSKQEPVPAR